jgi:myosin VI
MMDSQLVWARDSSEGYIQGRITELGSREFEVQPIDKKLAKRNCLFEDIFPSCENASDHDDNCKCLFLLFSEFHP